MPRYSRFWLIDGFRGDSDHSWQIGGPKIDYENRNEYAVYDTYTVDLANLVEDPVEDAEGFTEIVNCYVDDLVKELELLTEYLYDDIFFIMASNNYGWTYDVMVAAPVNPGDFLQYEYDMTQADARKCIEIAKLYDKMDFDDAVKTVLGDNGESEEWLERLEDLERLLDWDWLLDFTQRFEEGMKELEDFRRRCAVSKGCLYDVDITGLYTLEQGEYADENIILFKSEPNSSLRYIMDRKTQRIWPFHYLSSFENKPALYFCMYLSEVYSYSGSGDETEKENETEVESRKSKALKSLKFLFEALGEPVETSRIAEFAEPLARAGYRKEALTLAL